MLLNILNCIKINFVCIIIMSNNNNHDKTLHFLNNLQSTRSLHGEQNKKYSSTLNIERSNVSIYEYHICKSIVAIISINIIHVTMFV